MESGDQRLTSVQPAFVIVGRIGRAHGVRGEVRVSILTDFPDQRFAVGSKLFLGFEDDPTPTPVKVASARPHHDVLLVRFDNTTTREEANELVGLFVCLPVSEVMPLEDDAYYEHELAGLLMVTDDGTEVGSVVRLMETGSVDVLEVHAESGRVHLVPMTGEVVASIDLDEGRITITPLPGLLD